MNKQFTDNAQKAIELAKKSAKNLQASYIGTEHILLGLIKEKNGLASKILENHYVFEDDLIMMIESLIAPEGNIGLKDKEGYTPRAKNIITASENEANRFKSEKIGTEHLLIAIIKDAEGVGARLLTTMNVNLQKMYVDILVSMGEDGNLYKEEFQGGKHLKKKNKVSSTPTLNQFSRDLTDLAAKGMLDPVIGRDREISRVIQILSRRNKNNPCLVGEPGVGKTAIAEGLAIRIVEGVVPETIKGKRLVTLDLSGVVAGSKYRGEFEERIKKIINEVITDGNIILFLDEIHTVIGAGGAEGAIDASNILKPSLARGEIRLIGATTINEYRKHIEKDAALERRFQPVNVEEPTIEETIDILNGLREKYEEHHNVQITQKAIVAAVNMSVRYINDRYLPDKALDLIDEAASKVRLGNFAIPENIQQLEADLENKENEKEDAIRNGDFDQAKELKTQQEDIRKKLEKAKNRFNKNTYEKVLTVDEGNIAEVVADWTKIPVKKLEEAETARLRKLEKELHKRVIGQDDAVSAVSKAIKRNRVGLKDPNRPIGSFLFLGPTGVGKTELSKALSQAMFGDEQELIRIDMSEYMEKHSVSKMIGSPPGYVGYEEGGQLSERVRRNPYSVILFDEIEKAHPDVFNVLLQVLDDGHITDSQGRKVSFKNTIIIMTSNIGAREIIEPKTLGFITADDEQKRYEDMKANVMEEVKHALKPEFINRIDEIIVFHALTKDYIKQVVNIMFKNLIKRASEQLGIKLVIRNSLKEHIAEVGYDSKYGARPLRRTIQSEVEDELAQEILDGNIKPGDEVAISYKQGKVTFTQC